MNYKHFTIEKRCCLQEYYIKEKSYRQIASIPKKTRVGLIGNAEKLLLL